MPDSSSTPPNAIYLDHAATTPLDSRVLAAMIPVLENNFGNPSSLHSWGKAARETLESARAQVAKALGCREASEIIFTSGATEADNLAILGVARACAHRGKHIITSTIEHPAVDAACDRLVAEGFTVTRLPLDAEGFVSANALTAAIRPDTVLASIIHGNNEIGTVQNIQALGDILRAKNILFHVDAVQTVGKLPIDFATLPVDYLSLSGHKVYGPKGVGALLIRAGAPLPWPQQVGGGQENDLRSGTENLAAIVGLAAALTLAIEALPAECKRLAALSIELIIGIQAAVPEAVLNGPTDVLQRVPGNVHFSFPVSSTQFVEGESLVLALAMRGVAVSSGSACDSTSIEPSRIVTALGKSEAIARSTVRFSLGRGTTTDDIQRVIALMPTVLKRFRK